MELEHIVLEMLGLKKNFVLRLEMQQLLQGKRARNYLIGNFLVSKRGKENKMVTKCKKLEIKESKKFKDMFSIYINGKVFDEPHFSVRRARTQAKRFGCGTPKVSEKAKKLDKELRSFKI